MSKQNSSLPAIDTSSLIKNMLIGAGIALGLITAFLIPVESRPEWGEFWMVRPFIIVPLAGAAGGACFYFIHRLLGRRKILAAVIGVIVFIIGLWMGTILGLDGTLWD